jgi:hypothetical protein
MLETEIEPSRISLPIAAVGPLNVPTKPILTASAAIAAGMAAGAMHDRVTIAAASHVRALRMSPPSAALCLCSRRHRKLWVKEQLL